MTPGEQGLQFHMLAQLTRLLQVTESSQPPVRVSVATLELKMMIHVLMPDLTVHFNMLIKKSCKFSCPKWVTNLLYGQTEEDNFKDIIHFLNMSIKINLKLI